MAGIRLQGESFVKKPIRVVIKRPNEEPRVEIIEHSLDKFNELVEGTIDMVRMDGFDLIINDEGLIHNMLPNIRWGEGYIAGPLVLVKCDEEGETVSLSEEEAARGLALLKQISLLVVTSPAVPGES